MSQIKGFTFFRSYYEVLQELDKAEQAELTMAMLEFAFDGVEPDLTSSSCRIAFKAIRPNLEKSIKRSQSGALGGAPKGNQNARKSAAVTGEEEEKKEQEEREREDGYRIKDKKVKKQSTDKQKTSKKQAKLYTDSLDYLNARTGSKYTLTDTTENQLSAIFDAGYTLDDVKKVIDRKYTHWHNDPKMQPFLTPSTLFKMDKFTEYLHGVPTIEERMEEQRRTTDEQRKKDAANKAYELGRELQEVNKQYLQETDKDKKHELWVRMQDLAAKIEIEEARLK